MKKKMKKSLILLLSLLMVLTMMPMGVWAEEGGTGEADPAPADNVAKIGETEYETLNEAIEQANDGDTIVLLGNCELSASNGVKVYKDITIQGSGEELITVTAEKLPGDRMIEIKTDSISKGLTFKNCNVNISDIPASGYAYNAVIIINSGKLVLDNCDMTIDGIQSDGTYNNMHGFWCLEGGDNLLSVVNGSNLLVQNFAHNAIEWDGTTKYYFEVKDSTYTSDHTRGGIIGTWDVTFENATVNVINSSGNGSNGSNYTIESSIVNYNDNGAHGLSAGNVVITDSLVTCKGNKYTGFHVAGTLEASTTESGKYKTKIDVTGNSWGTWGDDLFAGLRLIGNAIVNAGVTVNVSDNYGVGIRASGAAVAYTFADGVSLTVKTNGKPIASGTQYNTKGGGIWNGGSMTLPADTVLYNNHATTAGDDIYNTGTITFGSVGSDWTLDGAPDCTHVIDGWYHDGFCGDEEASRWNAHGIQQYYTELFDNFENGTTTVTGQIALKAAHGLMPADPDDPNAAEWAVSKSKTAENLDKNYESKVTLSLPAADYEPEIDVIFVMDDTHAGKEIFTASAMELLNELKGKENLDVNLGIVTFDAVARDWIDATSDTYSGLVSIKDEKGLEAIEAALNQQLSYDNEGVQKKVGGSNLEAPIEMAGKMLSKGNGTEKHVILFSDMYGYVYCGNMEINGKTYDDIPVSKHFGKNSSAQLALYKTRYASWSDLYKNYSAAEADENISNRDDFFRESSWENYWKIYQGLDTPPGFVTQNYPSASMDYPANTQYRLTGFEKSSVLTYNQIQSLLKNDIQMTIINNEFNPNGAEDSSGTGARIQQIKNEMLSDLKENGVTVLKTAQTPGADDFNAVFTSLKNELIQLVDAGSYVIDEIGSGTDNKGNDYNFDFADSLDKLTLTVGEKALDETDLSEPDLFMSDPTETARYGFGAVTNDGGQVTGYQFVLHYYKDGTTLNGKKYGECFKWDIDTAVTVDKPVRLTYTVKLTNPKTVSGTYGVYDRNGDGKDDNGNALIGAGSLCTNNSATLYPFDSNGEQGLPELFNKPTVSYTVSSGGGGGGGGGSTTTPTLNKEDHYAYIIGYPEDYSTGEATDDKSLWPVKPENSITRAEVATIFFRMLTDDSRSEYWMQTNPYSDVKASIWYNNAISTLTNGKIINGYEDGTFQPNAPITRAEFAAMAARFSDVEYSGSNSFSDVSDNYWAAKYIALAEHLGWINGYPDGTFKPSQPITRAEAMKLVNEVLDRTPDKEKMLDSMIKWPDNDENAWYYAHVQEATNSHEYEERKSATNPEKWTSILEVRAWADLEREWSSANSSRNPGEVVKTS